MRLALIAGFLIAVCSAFAQELPRRAVLGIPATAPTPAIQEKFKIGPQGGLVVGQPPAAMKGDVKQGDVIVEVNGKGFKSFAEFNLMLRDIRPGTEIALTVLDADGNKAQRKLELRERPREVSEKYDVIYDHAVTNGLKVRTIVTKPKREGKFPVFVWIQGISVGSVDTALTANGPTTNMLRNFADDYVTYRIEKIGVGDSEGPAPMEVNFEQEVDAFRQGLKALDKYSFVDRSNVILFGHSMGGCIVPILASEMPFKGIIAYGTVAESWLEWSIRAARFQGLLGGIPPKDIQQEVRNVISFYHYLFNEKKSVEWIKKEHPELAETADAQSPDSKNLSARSIEYMRQADNVNFGDVWSRIGDSAALALYGQFDFLPIEGDHPQLIGFVNKVKPGKGTYIKIPGTDHLFGKVTSYEDARARFGSAEFNPEVVRIVKEWIASLK